MSNALSSATSYRFLLLPIALGLLVPPLIMPWVTLNFLGTSNLSPLDLIPSSFDGMNSDITLELVRDHPKVLFHDLVRSYNATALYLISIVTYLVSIAAMTLSISLKNSRKLIICLIAGVLAITSAIFWFIMIESVKESFAQQAALTGGLIGGEFKGSERTLANTLLNAGLGPYMVAAGGAVGIFNYFIQRRTLITSSDSTVNTGNQSAD